MLKSSIFIEGTCSSAAPVFYLNCNDKSTMNCIRSVFGLDLSYKKLIPTPMAKRILSIFVFALSFGLDIAHVAAQKIPANQLFVLNVAERKLFGTNPPATPGVGYEEQPLCNIFNAFNSGKFPVPLNPNQGPDGWYELNGKGSQNHAILWQGECALAYALKGDKVNYEIAAKNCLKLLALDKQQGHERQESFGKYNGFWESAIASMALAGMYAPANCPSGPMLLADARAWWSSHIAVLRRLRMPDGQVAQVGSRTGGDPGTFDSWHGLAAAVTLQMIDPQSYSTLFPTLAKLLTADGKPYTNPKKCMVQWSGVSAANERWLVYRAYQTGAIVRPAANHPVPLVVQTIYKWTKNGRIYIATPKVTGYRPCRWETSWKAGELVRVEIADPNGPASGGKGPHLPPAPQKVVIPSTAKKILGPAGLAGRMADAAEPTIMDVEPNQDLSSNVIVPELRIRNNGSQAMTELAVFYQIDGGAVSSKIFSEDVLLQTDEEMTFVLDAINLAPGCHELKVTLNDPQENAEAAIVQLENVKTAATESDLFNISVFPNPASEFLQVTVELKAEVELKAKLVNSLGQIVDESGYGIRDAGPQVLQMDVKNHPAGFYYLQIIEGNNVATKKIVITH